MNQRKKSPGVIRFKQTFSRQENALIQKNSSPGQKRLLCIALGAALSAMLPAHIMAQQVTIDSSNSYNSTCTLSGGDLLITNTGSITSAGSIAINVGTLAVGTFNNAGSISAFSLGLSFSGLANIGTLVNSGRIYGGSAAMEVHGTIGTLSNSGTITGGVVGMYVTSNGTLNNATNGVNGTLNGNYGFLSEGTVGNVNNQGAINGALYGIFTPSGTIGTLTNAGTISGVNAGVSNSAQIGTLSSSGIISATSASGTAAAINNNTTGTITSLQVNGGTISGHTGIYNTGLISNLNISSGTVNDSATGIYNGSLGTITSLSNGGTITGTSYGIQTDNGSKIASLVNTGTGMIRGGTGILAGNLTPSGTITVGTLTNAGNITGTTNVGVGTSANGTIASLSNSGVITGALGGVGNAGSIGTLVNTGTISSAGYAVYNAATGTLGPVTNSGLIAGTIANLPSRDQTINGGTGSTFGTLTGTTGNISASGMGSIVNSGANLILGSGNILLNDNINVGSHTVSNAGSTLQLNNRATITGNYSQGAGARLLIGVNNGATSAGSTSDTGYGYLYVQGNSTIASDSTIGLTRTNSYAFANGQKYVALVTTGATNYNTSNLNYSLPGFTVTGANVAEGGNTSLVLTLGTLVTPGDTSPPSTAVKSFATTPNAVSALNSLSNYSGANVNLLNVFNATAALGSTAAANKAGAVLSPTANTVAATQSSTAATTQVLGVVAAHVDGLRVAQASGDSGVSTGEAANDWAVWAQSFGGSARQDMRDNISGFRSSYTGLVLGADRMVSERWRAGGLLSYASNSISGRDDNTGSSSHVNSYGLMGYGGYAADGWYVDVVAGAVRHKYDANRLVDFADFSATANGSFNGMQYATSVLAGMPLKLDGAWARTTLTPLVGLGYSITRQNGYTETGGNGAALSVNGNKNSSLKSELGVKLERSFTTAYGELVPAVQIGWHHEFHDRAMQSVSSFAADATGTTSFTSAGATPVRDTGVLALSATLVRLNNLSVVARYTLEAGSGYVGQTGDVRLRYQF